MLLIHTKIKPSGTHGIGLFSDQFIKKGTITWEYISWFEISYSEEDMTKMSDSARRQVMWYAYFEQKIGRYILCADDQRFINHSNAPEKINIESMPDQDVAARDILPGEELLCDYSLYEPDWFERRGVKRECFK